MKNIVDAVITLVKRNNFTLTNSQGGNNRINIQGDALEDYVKNLFADTFNCVESERLESWCENFSYIGNNANPPDLMLKGGDAVEVKKIESPDSVIALNSSYPKHTLKSSNPLISRACREAEIWTEKDIIYAVGVVNKNRLKHLCMIYGQDYFSSKYGHAQIEENICFATGLEISLKRTNIVEIPLDSLGVVYVQISGCVKSPWNIFSYIYNPNLQLEFNFMCIINSEKWETLNNREELVKLQKYSALKIADVKIKNPDNPAKLNDAKLITYSLENVKC